MAVKTETDSERERERERERISVLWPPSWNLWVAVQITTCRGGGILWRPHCRPHYFSQSVNQSINRSVTQLEAFVRRHLKRLSGAVQQNHDKILLLLLLLSDLDWRGLEWGDVLRHSVARWRRRRRNVLFALFRHTCPLRKLYPSAVPRCIFITFSEWCGVRLGTIGWLGFGNDPNHFSLWLGLGLQLSWRRFAVSGCSYFILFFFLKSLPMCSRLQCFDTVRWATWSASGP